MTEHVEVRRRRGESEPDRRADFDPPRLGDTLQKAFAEQQKALENASLVVHSAVVERGWRKELAHEKDAAKIVINLDIELSGYGYRIDPDDFVIIDETKTGDADLT